MVYQLIRQVVFSKVKYLYIFKFNFEIRYIRINVLIYMLILGSSEKLSKVFEKLNINSDDGK